MADPTQTDGSVDAVVAHMLAKRQAALKEVPADGNSDVVDEADDEGVGQEEWTDDTDDEEPEQEHKEIIEIK